MLGQAADILADGGERIAIEAGQHDIVEADDLDIVGHIEFEFGAGEDSRPQVAKAVIQAGYELLEMRPIGLSLEEIFLELTRDNAAGKKPL